jgi:hypothetical protein
MLKPKQGTKMRIIWRMLRRKQGCTASEVREAVDWPSVSIPQRAKQLGLKLRWQKAGRHTRYWAA